MRPLLAVLVLAAPAAAGPPPDPAALARRIDAHIAAKLAAAGVPPGPSADDATFLRRATLTLSGRIPSPAAVRAYLGDTDPAKKRKLLDRLFTSPGSADHLTAVWRGWLIPEADAGPGMDPSFDAWLRPRVRDNLRLDRLVAELLTAPFAPPPETAATAAGGDDEADEPDRPAASPAAFYAAKEGKPENLAAATARLFLGAQMDCAQCHDHPSGAWTRDQFWQLAAFFAGVEPAAGGPYAGFREVPGRRELPIPNTGRTVRATFPDGTAPGPGGGGRAALAEWITAPGNPLLARAAANRAWALLFGVGLADPADDLSADNPPSHPELLAELAAAFRDGGYDFRYLLTAVMLSDAYGRTSAAGGGPSDVRLFARFPVQGLTPGQLFDSLTAIAGRESQAKGRRAAADADAGRGTFADRFRQVGKPTETPTTLLQSLTLMNGELVAAAADPRTGRAVATAAGLPGLSGAERVTVLYLTALGRPPTPAERDRAVRHVGGGTEADRRWRLGDVMWALLNGVEFRTNH